MVFIKIDETGNLSKITTDMNIIDVVEEYYKSVNDDFFTNIKPLGNSNNLIILYDDGDANKKSNTMYIARTPDKVDWLFEELIGLDKKNIKEVECTYGIKVV